MRQVKKTTTSRHNLKVDNNAHVIINRVRRELIDKGIANVSTSDVIRELDTEAAVGRTLCDILVDFAGETGKNESAVDTLRRLIHDFTASRSIS
jgi:hypothetical protein